MLRLRLVINVNATFCDYTMFDVNATGWDYIMFKESLKISNGVT